MSEFLSKVSSFIIYFLAIFVIVYVFYLGIFKPEPTMHDLAFMCALVFFKVSGGEFFGFLGKSKEHDECCK